MAVRRQRRGLFWTGVVSSALIMLLYAATVGCRIEWAYIETSGKMWWSGVVRGAWAAGWEDLRNSGNNYLYLPKGLEITSESDNLAESLVRFTWMPDITWDIAVREICIPLWMPLAIALAIVIWTRPRPHPAGHCQKCGYDLRASPERCPECGTMRPKV